MYNLIFVGYYLFENLKVVFSVVVFFVVNDYDLINKFIVKRVIYVYVEFEKKYSKK